ncbi:MAG: inorganic phosphate transporter [Flavobacteriaceae bacterium]
MDNIYLYIIILLSILAIGDLIVGVSNDAVNFLNSAIGSKVFSFRRIMIFASIGVACGALFSSGMMEVARKGIFNPEAFFFDEIIYIFMAVMITDILLLDFFNTLGMPTSTTVSIVFELLGAAVVMSFIKIFENSGNISELSSYINTSKAVQIILGILLSVFIAFTIGALIQWASRLILTHKFDQKGALYSTLFGGISLSAICNFILIKGIKGTPYATASYDFLSGQTINTFLETNGLLVNLINLVVWVILSYVMHKVLRWDIYKIIIGIGTFALALAFAGNDLVNFIGVPVAAYQSYEAWVHSGVAASDFGMGVLANKVATPTLFLALSGLVMILTLWFSTKARRVVKTSLDLSDQNQIRERFTPNFISRGLVRLFSDANKIITRQLPPAVQARITRSFTAVIEVNKKEIDRPVFDKLRASINLVVAAILISIATSLKLPLSTTYVTFMVAMGTSLADRAWDNDSAVYRVAGVLNVIIGWFFTALAAFLVSGTIVYIIHVGGAAAISVILFIILLMIGKNFLNARKIQLEGSKEIKILRSESSSLQGVIVESSDNIIRLLEKSIGVYRLMIEGLSHNDMKKLEKASMHSRYLSEEIEDLKNNIFYFVKRLDDNSLLASNFYIKMLGSIHDLTEDLQYLTRICFDHTNNNHKKLRLSQIRDLQNILEQLNNVYKESDEAFKNRFVLKEYEDVMAQKKSLFDLVNSKIDRQILLTREVETSPKNTTLYFNILIRTKDLVVHKFDLIDEFYAVVKQLRNVG